jgi:NAD-dependent DNA ligase
MSSDDKKPNQAEIFDAETPIDIARALAENLFSRAVNTDAVKIAVERVFRHHDKKMQAALVAFASAKLERAISLHKKSAEIENRLFDPQMIGSATAAQLIRMFGLCNSVAGTDMEFVTKVMELGGEIEKHVATISSNQQVEQDLSVAMAAFPDTKVRAEMKRVVDDCLQILKSQDRILDASETKKDEEDE